MGAIYLAEDLNAFNRLRVVKEMLDYFDINDPQQVANAHSATTRIPVVNASSTNMLGPRPATATPQSSTGICPDPRVVLRSPVSNAVLRGIANIEGTAVHASFRYYKLEYAPGADVQPDFAYLAGEDKPVDDGVLAVWYTTTLPNGVYTLRLMTVERNGNYPQPCQVNIRIQN